VPAFTRGAEHEPSGGDYTGPSHPHPVSHKPGRLDRVSLEPGIWADYATFQVRALGGMLRSKAGKTL